jgi:catalase
MGSFEVEPAPTYTLAEGCPVADPTTAQHFGGNSIKGLILLQYIALSAS